MEKKRPLLSISMLVSNNRRDTIEKCMESLVPLMKAVPCELVIVDTGCTDGSVDIARKYADKVVQFTWCKDFSAARNAGLRECTGEWFLYLDDDEWFGDVSELIEFFTGEERQYCDALWYIQRNYDNFEGTVFTDTYVGRCAKLTSETKFCGKIHEWLEPLPKMIKKVGTFVHHYGYVFKSEEERDAHLERNLTLEEAAVKEDPDDVRMCSQLVQEYRAAAREEDAERVALETLARTKHEKTNSFVQYLMVTVPKIYLEMEDPERALKEYARLEAEEVLLHQSKLTIYCERAYLYGRQEKAAEALEESLKYLREYEIVPGEDEPAEFPIMDFERYYSEFTRQRVIKVGITGAMLSGAYDKMDCLFARFDWSHDMIMSAGHLQVLGQYYVQTGDGKLFLREFSRALQVEDLRMAAYATLHSVYEESGIKWPEFVTTLEQLNRRDGNFGYFHLLYTENKGNTTEQDIADYYEKSDRKYDEEVARLFLDKQEMKLLAGVKRPVGATEALVRDYIGWAKRYADAICGPEEWEKETLSVDLPMLRFAHKMEQVLETEDMASYGAGLKQALALYPVMLPVAKTLLAEREVVLLAEQLKAMVRMQLAEGKTEEAKAILSELATLVPEDEEVKALLQGM